MADNNNLIDLAAFQFPATATLDITNGPLSLGSGELDEGFHTMTITDLKIQPAKDADKTPSLAVTLEAGADKVYTYINLPTNPAHKNNTTYSRLLARYLAAAGLNVPNGVHQINADQFRGLLQQTVNKQVTIFYFPRLQDAQGNYNNNSRETYFILPGEREAIEAGTAPAPTRRLKPLATVDTAAAFGAATTGGAAGAFGAAASGNGVNLGGFGAQANTQQAVGGVGFNGAAGGAAAGGAVNLGGVAQPPQAAVGGLNLGAL